MRGSLIVRMWGAGERLLKNRRHNGNITKNQHDSILDTIIREIFNHFFVPQCVGEDWNLVRMSAKIF